MNETKKTENHENSDNPDAENFITKGALQEESSPKKSTKTASASRGPSSRATAARGATRTAANSKAKTEQKEQNGEPQLDDADIKNAPALTSAPKKAAPKSSPSMRKERAPAKKSPDLPLAEGDLEASLPTEMMEKEERAKSPKALSNTPKSASGSASTSAPRPASTSAPAYERPKTARGSRPPAARGRETAPATLPTQVPTQAPTQATENTEASKITPLSYNNGHIEPADKNLDLHKEADLWPEAWPEITNFTLPSNPHNAEKKFASSEKERVSTNGASKHTRGRQKSRPNSRDDSNEDVRLNSSPDSASDFNADSSSNASTNASPNTSPNASHDYTEHGPDFGPDSTDSANIIFATNEPNGRQEKRGRGSRGSSTEKSKKERPNSANPKEREAEEDTSKDTNKGKCIMYMSVLPGEQIEVAIAKGGRLQEYYVQMLHQASTRSNIYKGVIHNIDASLQAAFISYGANKNGFLQIDEVHPEYYLAPHDTSKGKKYPLIQKVLKAGQEVLVQVIKEPTAGKGAFLSTYLSIPGRFLVLTPGRPQLGISRKVESEEDRERLRELLKTLPASNELGVIVRTASLNASKTTMLKDLQFLKRLWKDVRTKGATEPAPALIYEEPGLASRAIRDYLSDDIKEVWVDDEATSKEIGDIVSLVFPRRASQNIVKLHSDADKSMWSVFNLQQQIDQVYSREVPLPSGGRIALDQTEALMAIDINSGKIGGRSNFESMALRTNMEAAEAIAEQLRLRDIGGQIVIDFIEMRERNHWRDLEKVMRSAMKNDRARYDIAKVSPFGLMEVVRQRLASSAISITMEPCPCCEGTGLRRNMEWQALRTLRGLQTMLKLDRDPAQTVVSYEVKKELALYLLNKKRNGLAALEQQFGVEIEIKSID